MIQGNALNIDHLPSIVNIHSHSYSHETRDDDRLYIMFKYNINLKSYTQ